jgi:hypothetical protein
MLNIANSPFRSGQACGLARFRISERPKNHKSTILLILLILLHWRGVPGDGRYVALLPYHSSLQLKAQVLAL